VRQFFVMKSRTMISFHFNLLPFPVVLNSVLALKFTSLVVNFHILIRKSIFT